MCHNNTKSLLWGLYSSIKQHTPMRTPKEIYIHAFNEGLNEGIAGGAPPSEEEISKMADNYLSSTPSWPPSNEEIEVMAQPRAVCLNPCPEDATCCLACGEKSFDWLNEVPDFANHWDGPDNGLGQAFQAAPSYENDVKTSVTH